MILILLCIPTFIMATNYDAMLDEMNQLASNYPAYVQLMDIGKNDQNITIYGLKIENLEYAGNKSNQLLVGCHHGNETHSATVCINFTKQLINIFQNSSDALYTGLSRSIFYVIPVLNISGYNNRSRYEKGPSSSYDPNRDYPDPCASNSYFKLASIRNLANFVERYNIIGAVTTHGYVGTFTYPWGIYTKNTKTKDNELFHSMAAASVKANNYSIGTHADQIYPASGAFEDWAYHAHGVWVMLMEHKRSPELTKDAKCLLTYFSLVPETKSTQHAHESSNCRASIASEMEDQGRP